MTDRTFDDNLEELKRLVRSVLSIIFTQLQRNLTVITIVITRKSVFIDVYIVFFSKFKFNLQLNSNCKVESC